MVRPSPGFDVDVRRSGEDRHPARLLVPLGPGFDLEAVFARLPAEARARVAWARKPVKEGLLELRKGDLTDEAIQAAARKVWRPFLAIGQALWEAIGNNWEQASGAVTTLLQGDRDMLERFVDDRSTSDTIEWIIEFFQAYFGIILAILQSFKPEALRTMVEQAREHITEIETADELEAILVGQVAFMAALDAARAGEDRERTGELIDIAFLELSRVRDVMQRAGLPILPFRDETPEQRMERTLRYAEHARTTLHAADLAALEGASWRDQK